MLITPNSLFVGHCTEVPCQGLGQLAGAMWHCHMPVAPSKGLQPAELLNASLHALWLCCYRGAFEAGQPLSGFGAGLVKASKSSKFKEGDVVTGVVPWSTYFVEDTAGQVRHNICSTACLRTSAEGNQPLSALRTCELDLPEVQAPPAKG